jgi:hypothetical protein
MPTGYTYAVADGTVSDLRTFALTCARGMGALIMMRDEPSNADIPKRFEADTTYHDNEIATALQRLAELEAMDEAFRVSACLDYNQKLAADKRDRIAKNDEQRARYEAMIAQVERWSGAPEGLREFMLSQLRQSVDFDCSADPTKYMGKPKSLTHWYGDELRAAAHSIQYHKKGRADEIARTAERNAWLERLFASLPSEASK